MAANSFGERSLEITMAFFELYSSLKVWKNSWIVLSFPVLLAEVGGRYAVFYADRVDQFVREDLGGDVEHFLLRSVLQNEVSDRVHQVCLSQADAAVDKQRVIDLAGIFRDCERGGVSHFIIRSDDEAVEGILFLEVRLLIAQGSGEIRLRAL